jgi:hypothetical protein
LSIELRQPNLCPLERVVRPQGRAGAPARFPDLILEDLAQDDRRVQLRLDPVTDLSRMAAGIAVALSNGVIVLDLR